MARLFRALLKIVAVLVAIPLVLVPAYSLSFIHPVSTLMLVDHFTFQPVERDWVPLSDIAPVLVHSVMMSEDGRFCEHDGVDWGALNSVIDDALEGERTRGASTIPMQTAKNLFLWTDRSFIRKGLEIPLALYADAVWSKRRMMEIYLNIAEWDDGVYGVEAASWHYFDKPAFALNAKEAALLAVTLPAPGSRNPSKPSRSLRRLAATVERRARASGAYVQCVKPEQAR